MGLRHYQRSMYGVMLGDGDAVKEFFAQHGHPVDEDELDDMGNEAFTENMGDNMMVVGVDPSGDSNVVGIHCKTASKKVIAEFHKYFPNVEAEMINFTETM